MTRDEGPRFVLRQATASMVPAPRAQPSMNRARNAMMRAASSRLSTPATHAAAISPTLWPTTAEGMTPHDFHNSAKATCMAKMAGCAISVRCILRVFSCGASSSSKENFAHGAIAAAHRSMASRKTGSCRINSRPMPHHCGPCPLMTKATRGGCSGRGVKEVRDFQALLPSLRKPLQFLHEFRHRVGHQREAERMMIAPRAEGIDQIGQNRRRAIGVGALCSQAASCSCGRAALPPSARKARRATRAIVSRRSAPARGGGRLREDDVRIGAAKAEGVHPRHALAVGLPETAPARSFTRSFNFAKSMCGLGVLK